MEIKLNLGCGNRHEEGYINVDKYGEPDLRHDLEVFPWPWEDSTVDEIVLRHVLEHLGQSTETYLNIIRELYRVCKDQASIHIMVPHPRHDDFMIDPTHVRKITPDGLAMFSKKNNEQWIKDGYANTPLGIYIDVDLEISKITIVPDPVWGAKLKSNAISAEEFNAAAIKYNNVIKEYSMIVKVKK
jgi:hypothetical protein